MRDQARKGGRSGTYDDFVGAKGCITVSKSGLLRSARVA